MFQIYYQPLFAVEEQIGTDKKNKEKKKSIFVPQKHKKGNRDCNVFLWLVLKSAHRNIKEKRKEIGIPMFFLWLVPKIVLRNIQEKG